MINKILPWVLAALSTYCCWTYYKKYKDCKNQLGYEESQNLPKLGGIR